MLCRLWTSGLPFLHPLLVAYVDAVFMHTSFMGCHLKQNVTTIETNLTAVSTQTTTLTNAFDAFPITGGTLDAALAYGPFFLLAAPPLHLIYLYLQYP